MSLLSTMFILSTMSRLSTMSTMPNAPTLFILKCLLASTNNQNPSAYSSCPYGPPYSHCWKCPSCQPCLLCPPCLVTLLILSEVTKSRVCFPAKKLLPPWSTSFSSNVKSKDFEDIAIIVRWIKPFSRQKPNNIIIQSFELLIRNSMIKVHKFFVFKCVHVNFMDICY